MLADRKNGKPRALNPEQFVRDFRDTPTKRTVVTVAANAQPETFIPLTTPSRPFSRGRLGGIPSIGSSVAFSTAISTGVAV